MAMYFPYPCVFYDRMNMPLFDNKSIYLWLQLINKSNRENNQVNGTAYFKKCKQLL